ncbi:TonB-dependent receptor [Sphingomicrobium sediminis]|uniref:TonB-dependent receptor n=1 Tax=Sphingomicrobium sediminis TaxID=2950949 RepID=A0A9X2J3Y9_9SPHN|nr:TonB-dependent receptor [Sphingomicrobium sediminis]MCM8557801.1 TonB-dependent receptor [Sphingomicrobium sediminis]
MLGTASTLAICMGLATPAFAQDTTPPEDEEEGTDAPVTEEDDTILITGFVQSLNTAQDIKRDADTFVDVISAEDIGALPDRSVAESLQRVPGVNISRFEQRDDPDRFSVEGSGVIIRGLPYVRSELNGRDIFSANGGRALSFNDVSPELLGRVEVYKNQTADMVEGGISGLVNLVTRKPLDNAGLKVAGTIEANYGSLAEEWSPGFSVLASNTWDSDSMGTFGLQVGYAQSELKSRADASQITDPCYRDDTLDGPCFRVAPVTSAGYDPDNASFDDASFPPAGTLITPKGAGVRTTQFERDRRAYSAVGQWESPNGNLVATVEYLRAETEANLSEFAVLAQVNEAINFPTIVDGTNPVIIGNEVVSATLTQLTADDVNNPGVLTPGIPTELLRFQRQDDAMTEDFSVDLDFSLTDRLRGNFEWQYINSDRTEEGIILANRTFADIFYDNRGDTPIVQFLQPGSSGANQNVSDPEGVFYWFHLDNQVRNEGELYSTRADFEYDVDLGPLKQARFGARWAERDRTTRSANFSNWSNLGSTWTTRQGDWSWGSLEPGRFFGAGGGAYVVDFPDQANLYDPFGENFQNGEVPAPVGAAYYYGGADLVTPYVNGDIEADLQAIKDFTRSPEGRPLIYSRAGLVDGTFLDGEISKVGESTLAAYGRLDFEHEFDSGIVLEANAGVRWVETTVQSRGELQLIGPEYIDAEIEGGRGGDGDGVAEVSDALNRCANIATGQTGPGYCELSSARLQEFVNSLTGEIVDDSTDVVYDNWLPSFNAKLDFGNGMLIRGAVSKGISRPDLAAYRTGGFVADNTRTLVQEGTLNDGALFAITTGNRLIRPIESWNYDLSFEYYWDDVGSLTVSAFKKDFSNLLTFGPAPRQFDIGSVQDLDVLVFGTINQGDAGLQGVEVAYQDLFQFLPGILSGFGTQLTYTYVDANDFGSDGDVFPNLPLPGVSEHTVNAVLFYEKGPLSARAAYNWRSEFLQTPRDVIFPFSPIYGEATGQLDASIFYSITDNVKLGVQGVNLLDEVIETSYVLDFDGTRSRRSAFRTDRRFSAILRFDF